MAKLSLVLLLVLFAAAPWSVAGYMSKFKAATACAAGNSGNGCEKNPQLKEAMNAKAAINFDDWVEDEEAVNLIQKRAVLTAGKRKPATNSELNSPQESPEDAETSPQQSSEPVELVEHSMDSDVETSADESDALPSSTKEAAVKELDSSKALAIQNMIKEGHFEEALNAQLKLEKEAGEAAVETLIHDQEKAGNDIVSEPSVTSLAQAAAEAVVDLGEETSDAEEMSEQEAAAQEIADLEAEEKTLEAEDKMTIKMTAIEEPSHTWVDHAPLRNLDEEPEI
eukprot:gnl/TRDRNA2_/TRDRNA2_39289_c0_seq1.p1 gnl/TRDRNA2_/TRDRNA2_39289_c0~~gnl/TRDRNA2_/TRDRNA2_39289_c0_seq1.p1  ORF type:complete len:282 (-),score=95.08 gnl/TRDRNA2_/TRDRNA2_39289_c0_seq1:38-883(-)